MHLHLSVCRPNDSNVVGGGWGGDHEKGVKERLLDTLSGRVTI